MGRPVNLESTSSKIQKKCRHGDIRWLTDAVLVPQTGSPGTTQGETITATVMGPTQGTGTTGSKSGVFVVQLFPTILKFSKKQYLFGKDSIDEILFVPISWQE